MASVENDETRVLRFVPPTGWIWWRDVRDQAHMSNDRALDALNRLADVGVLERDQVRAIPGRGQARVIYRRRVQVAVGVRR